jgi:NAD(P)-dependent dehydrogenase (short-subunit alcohol dehydrogenase family)
MQLAIRIALITGSSRGIGAAVAKRFAAEGAQVILTARTVGGLEEVDDALRGFGKPATIVPLDLRQGEKIDALGAEIYRRYGRLDVLVGNAAMLGSLSPLAHASPAEFDDIFRVNVTANYRLLRALDPLLRKSDAGRVIMVTSGAAAAPIAYWGPYASSKAALEHLTLTYAAENHQTPIRANLIDPGAVRTRMRAQAFPGENPESLPAPEEITDLFVDLAGPKAPQGKIIRVSSK